MKKKMKLTTRLIRYLNVYINLLLYIQYNYNIPILIDNNDELDYSIWYKKKKYSLNNKEYNSKKEQRDLIDKRLENDYIRNLLLKYIP